MTVLSTYTVSNGSIRWVFIMFLTLINQNTLFDRFWRNYLFWKLIDKKNCLNYIDLILMSSRFKSYKLTTTIQMPKLLFSINEVPFDLAFFSYQVWHFQSIFYSEFFSTNINHKLWSEFSWMSILVLKN